MLCYFWELYILRISYTTEIQCYPLNPHSHYLVHFMSDKQMQAKNKQTKKQKTHTKLTQKKKSEKKQVTTKQPTNKKEKHSHFC